MKVRVKYFASIRERLGSGETVELPDASTVDALRDRLIAGSPARAEALAHGRAVCAALNQTLCDGSAVIADGAEVAFFPPVTGG